MASSSSGSIAIQSSGASLCALVEHLLVLGQNDVVDIIKVTKDMRKAVGITNKVPEPFGASVLARIT